MNEINKELFDVLNDIGSKLAYDLDEGLVFYHLFDNEDNDLLRELWAHERNEIQFIR